MPAFAAAGCGAVQTDSIEIGRTFSATAVPSETAVRIMPAKYGSDARKLTLDWAMTIVAKRFDHVFDLDRSRRLCRQWIGGAEVYLRIFRSLNVVPPPEKLDGPNHPIYH